MADNTRNDDDTKAKRATKTAARGGAKPQAKRDSARRADAKRDTKKAGKRREGGFSFNELDANTKKLILGAAAVAGAGAAGALFAAWRKHADGLFDFGSDDSDTLINDQDADSLSGTTGLGTADNTGGTATGGARAAKAGSGKRNGSAKSARDSIDADKRDAFAPATVPLNAASADA